MKKIVCLEKEFVWERPHDLFAFNHAATCIKNEQGDLLTVYSGGTFEATPDYALWMSRKIGGQWQEPKRIKYIYGLPHFNPVLHAEGDKIILYYKVGQNCSQWYTVVTESYDFGETWTPMEEAIPDDHTSRVVTKNNILVTEDGRWLGPCSTEDAEHWDCHIEISEDKGKTWVKHNIPITHWECEMEDRDYDLIRMWKADGVIQPALWQSDENTFHCLMRSTRGFIYRSDSTDGGNTWCEAYPTQLPNNNSSITVAQLEDQTLVLVLNPNEGNHGIRTPLSVLISEDNGATWYGQYDLETEEGEFSYPYVITDGKTVDVVYTWKNEKIAHCVLCVQDED